MQLFAVLRGFYLQASIFNSFFFFKGNAILRLSQVDVDENEGRKQLCLEKKRFRVAGKTRDTRATTIKKRKNDDCDSSQNSERRTVSELTMKKEYGSAPD